MSAYSTPQPSDMSRGGLSSKNFCIASRYPALQRTRDCTGDASSVSSPSNSGRAVERESRVRRRQECGGPCTSCPAADAGQPQPPERGVLDWSPSKSLKNTLPGRVAWQLTPRLRRSSTAPSISRVLHGRLSSSQRLSNRRRRDFRVAPYGAFRRGRRLIEHAQHRDRVVLLEATSMRCSRRARGGILILGH